MTIEESEHLCVGDVLYYKGVEAPYALARPGLWVDTDTPWFPGRFGPPMLLVNPFIGGRPGTKVFTGLLERWTFDDPLRGLEIGPDEGC